MKLSKKSIIKTNILLFILSVGLLLLTFSCAKKEQDVIKIGVVAPLTGPISPYGVNIKDGAQLAASEINEKGGINDRKIEFIVEDEGGGPSEAVNAVTKLIFMDKVSIIVGPATSNGVMASAPIAEKNHVVLFSPSGTSDNISDAGDYIFRNRASASQKAGVFIDYIIDSLGLCSFAILRADADYAVSFSDVCKNSINENSCSLQSEDVFAEGSTDYRSQLTKLMVNRPTALIIVGVPIELGNILKQIKELGLDVKVFSNTIDSPEIFKIAEGAEEGLTFVTTFYDPQLGDEKVIEFDKKFIAKYGRTSHLFGANAYDAIYILKDVIEKYGSSGNMIKKGLYNVKDFRGVAGVTEFDKNGDLQFTRVAIKKIVNGKFVLIKDIQR